MNKKRTGAKRETEGEGGWEEEREEQIETALSGCDVARVRV